MSDTAEEDFVKLLNNTFATCDVNGSGLVEINTLIHFLTSQDAAWHGNIAVEEEFHKLLSNEPTQCITKDQFVNSLLDWFKSSFEKTFDILTTHNSNSKEDLCLSDDSGRCLSSSSGIEESSESTYASSTHSMDKFLPSIYYVSEGQILSKEDLPDDVYINDNESPRNNLKCISALEPEMNALRRKNEYLEGLNSALHSQISCLDEAVTKYKKESADYAKQICSQTKNVEIHKQKQEEAEEKYNQLLDKNKTITIQLTQFERENSKLEILIEQLRKQADELSNEKLDQEIKTQEIAKKLHTLSDFHSKTLDELESLKIIDAEKDINLEKVIEQNVSLQSQLDLNIIHISELKSKLIAANKELCGVRNAKLKIDFRSPNPNDTSSPEDSMVFFETDLSFDDAVPFESSLLAELNDRVHQSQGEYCSACIKYSPFPVSDRFHDAAVNTDNSMTSEKASMTAPQDSCEVRNIQKKTNSPVFIRSNKAWITVGMLLLITFFLLGTLLPLITIVQNHPRKMITYLTPLFDLLHISIKPPDIPRPVY